MNGGRDRILANLRQQISRYRPLLEGRLAQPPAHIEGSERLLLKVRTAVEML
jgi:hypothetical protein